MVSIDKFIQARNYYVGRTSPVRLIVLHDMETDELLSDAEAVGNYFAGPNAPRASAHVGVDADSTVGYVRTADTAFGAPNANADGYHIEQAGRARQSREEWLDPFSRETIRRAAKAGFEASVELAIPRIFLTVAQVADRVTKGFTDHRTVSAAFGTPGGHSDPGEFYPWDVYFADMAALADPTPIPEDLVTYTYVKKPAPSGEVYVARRGETPLHVNNVSLFFADVEFLASAQGDRIVEAPGANVSVTDNNPNAALRKTRKVLELNSADSQRWFGL